MNANQPHNELQWDALRFVLDEMSGDEKTAFELLLAEDQIAREAVADAVRQTRLICLAEETMAPAATPHRAMLCVFAQVEDGLDSADLG